MTRHGRALLILAALAVAVTAAPAAAQPAQSSASCRVLKAPPQLGPTLRRLHLAYLRRTTRNPSIRGPIGRVHLGRCGAARYALATFSQRYNGLDFGQTDQPEYFTASAPGRWRDRGNTGGQLCGTAPAALLYAWHVVRAGSCRAASG